MQGTQVPSLLPHRPVAWHGCPCLRCSIHFWLITESFVQNGHWITWRRAQLNFSKRKVTLRISPHLEDGSVFRFQDLSRERRVTIWILVDQAHQLKLAVSSGLQFREKNILVVSPSSTNHCAGRQKSYVRLLNPNACSCVR